MTFEWTPHRFVSGALALDVANSVILRFNAAKRLDRFADLEELARFGTAAQQFSGERQLFGCLQVIPHARIPSFWTCGKRLIDISATPWRTGRRNQNWRIFLN